MSNDIAFNCDVKNRKNKYLWENAGIIKPAYGFVCPFTDTLVFGIFPGSIACENGVKIRLERKNKAREFTECISGQKAFVVSCLDARETFGESIYYAGDGGFAGVTHFHSFSGSLEGAVKGLIKHMSPENIVQAEVVGETIQSICDDPKNPLFPYVKITKEAVRGTGVMVSVDWEKEGQFEQVIKKITAKKSKKL